ncbi:hypothetical protein HYW44_01930 [Candidatus Daviesbacteria bacterium]|nr:hypothetical protein [Candidatus Daviesbacteria bacterium]
MKKFRIRILRNILLTVLFITILFTLSSSLFPIPSFAQCQTNDRNQGLISATSGVTGMFGNLDNVCITGNNTSYREFKVPSYQNLEEQFYTSSRSGFTKGGDLLSANGAWNFTGAGAGIYLQTKNVILSGVAPTATTTPPSGVQIIFIRGSLNITANIDYADTDSASGLVFIVRDNINIYTDVTKVNAVLISFGQICTAYLAASSGCSDGSTITQPLTINGSLISLNKNSSPASPLQLRRNLEDNDQPAEVVNKQPKYLYILKDGLFTKDLIITTEDQHYPITTAP